VEAVGVLTLKIFHRFYALFLEPKVVSTQGVIKINVRQQKVVEITFNVQDSMA